MLRKSCFRATMMLLILTITTGLPLQSVLAKDSDAVSTEGGNTGKFKGTVRNSQETYGSLSVSSADLAASAKEIFLRADMKYDTQTGQKNDIEPYYTEESKLSADEYGRLITSPLVSGRVELWKSWYCRVFDEIRPKGLKVPSDLQMKLNITVDKHGKVLVSTEWRTPSKTAEAEAYADKLIANIRAMEGQPWIAFPDKSWLELVKFDFYVTYDGGLQLGKGIQRIDCG
ncbi:MAG: hypothetical protein K2W95_13455 [Candidatus Obscuribacterales bacterium]|nr:hypothetical protein [Candidatus Obscuribacterales bacterium]